MAGSDADLVRRCIEGDQQAWCSLIERYGRLVYSIPRRYGLPAADVDDVYQTVFSRLVNRLPLLRDPTKIHVWLIQTATRESWRVRNRSRRHAQLDGTAENEADVDEPSLSSLEEEQLVRDSMRELDPYCRDLLTGLFCEDPKPSYQKLAARLGIPAGSLGPTRSRCLDKLAKLLRERGV